MSKKQYAENIESCVTAILEFPSADSDTLTLYKTCIIVQLNDFL